MKFPVILRLFVPLVSAIILHFYTSFSVSLEVLLFNIGLVLLLASPLLARHKIFNYFWNASYIVLFFLLGGYLAMVGKSAENEHYFANEDNGWNNYLVRLIEPPETKENSVKCLVEVLQVGERQSCGKALLYLEKDNNRQMPVYGDVLMVNGKFNSIRSNKNPKEFDYARYLRIHDI